MGVIPPDTPGIDVEVSNDSGNPLPVTVVNPLPSTQADIAYGLSSVLSGGQANIATIVAGPSGMLVHAIVATSNGDGLFELTENLATRMQGRTSGSDNNWIVSLPSPIFFAAGQTVALDVTNESAATAQFYGTIVYEQV